MSSTGTSTLTSIVFAVGGATTVTACAPPRKRAVSSIGRTVADRPMRCAGWGSSASRRSSDRARCAPRLVAQTACTSSMITVSTPRSDSRADDVSSRNSDSGVVIRTSGGRLAKARRSSAGVSPVRMPTVMSGSGSPSRAERVADADQRRPEIALDVDRERLERAHVEHAAALGGLGRLPLGRQPVDRPQERGQRLAGAGRRDDEGVLAGADGRPGLSLSRRWARRTLRRTTRASPVRRPRDPDRAAGQPVRPAVAGRRGRARAVFEARVHPAPPVRHSPR